MAYGLKACSCHPLITYIKQKLPELLAVFTKNSVATYWSKKHRFSLRLVKCKKRSELQMHRTCIVYNILRQSGPDRRGL